VYGLQDGLVRDLGMCVNGTAELDTCYRAAVGALGAGEPA
jgi:hypothetical protein